MKNLFKILFLILICSTISNAQLVNRITIKGKVVDKESKEPLENVNVFLANTTIGTTTDKDGKFIIDDVPYGSYNIIFSYIGYEVESRNFDSYKPYTFKYNISLKLKPININQVNVSAEVPEDWKEKLKIFKKIFIGETENSKSTKILNPEVLDFAEEKGTGAIKTVADSMLKIENKALGYMLYIVLDSVVYMPEKNITYKYFPRFEELSPSSEEEKLTWEKNRQNTYLDSPRHFYYALVHKQLSQNYYSLHEIPYMTAISPEDLNLTCDRDSSVYTLNYRGAIEVKYYSNNPSTLNFIYPSVSIDKNGNLLTYFYSVETYGYWAKQRIADILPRDYVYPDK